MSPDCPRCGSDEHAYCAPVCHYCSAPAVIESAIGLDGDYSDPNALGQRSYMAPRPEPRCEECQAGSAREKSK